MKNLFIMSLASLMILTSLTGCDKSTKYNPAKGLEVINRLQSAKNGGDSLELAKIAVDQNRILKDRAGAMDTMREAVRFCSDIQNSRERIEVYSQIAASYSELNAIVEARNALGSAMNAYQNWEEELKAADEKKRKEPTQGEIEALAGEKMEVLTNLARAQMDIVPLEAQKSLMLAKEEAKQFSDLLMKVDKLLELGSTLGKMESYDNLVVLADEVKAYLNGEAPVTATVSGSDDVEGTDGADDGENAEADTDMDTDATADADAENTEDSTDSADADEEKETKDAEDGEPQEIDMQQKSSRLATLGGIFVQMKHKDANAKGIEILDEAAEVARSIDNRGRKAITLCEIVVLYADAKAMDKAKATLEEAEPIAKKADSATREAADEALTKAKSAVGE